MNTFLDEREVARVVPCNEIFIMIHEVCFARRSGVGEYVNLTHIFLTELLQGEMMFAVNKSR